MLQRTIKHCRHAWGRQLIFLSAWRAALKLTGVAEGAVDVLWVVQNWFGESWEQHEMWNKKLCDGMDKLASVCVEVLELWKHCGLQKEHFGKSLSPGNAFALEKAKEKVTRDG